jgi:hypothetical protein
MDETSLRGRKVHSITSMDDKLARLALRGITILASAGASPNTHLRLVSIKTAPSTFTASDLF